MYYWFIWIYVHHSMISTYSMDCFYLFFFFFWISYLSLFHSLHYYRSYSFYSFCLLVFITYMLTNLQIFNLLINKYLGILSHSSFFDIYVLIGIKINETWSLFYTNQFRFTKLFAFCAFHPLLHFRPFIWESLSFCLEYILYNSL